MTDAATATAGITQEQRAAIIAETFETIRELDARIERAKATIERGKKQLAEAEEERAQYPSFGQQAAADTETTSAPDTVTDDAILEVLGGANDWLARVDIADALGIDRKNTKARDGITPKLNALRELGKAADNGLERAARRWATAENAESWIATAE